MNALPTVRRAVIAGSGFYDWAALDDVTDVLPETPFGAPSAAIRVGTIGGQPVAFLARHGLGHRLLPSEINHRANVFALKLLGVEQILSASAVGSMKEAIRPRDMVLVDQFIDRTAHRPASFFGNGIAAHVAFADPICPVVRGVLLRSAASRGARTHDGGTYVCIEGPAFSTRAESRLYRSWGVDVIGMTNLQEAKLAREAEICYATLAMATDYDCWHDEEQDVSVGAVLDNLRANAALAQAILRQALAALPERGTNCPCGSALQNAILTPKDRIDPDLLRRLAPIVGRYVKEADEADR